MAQLAGAGCFFSGRFSQGWGYLTRTEHVTLYFFFNFVFYSILLCVSLFLWTECVTLLCHILPPSEIDWGLSWDVFAGSKGKSHSTYLFVCVFIENDRTTHFLTHSGFQTSFQGIICRQTSCRHLWLSRLLPHRRRSSDCGANRGDGDSALLNETSCACDADLGTCQLSSYSSVLCSRDS